MLDFPVQPDRLTNFRELFPRLLNQRVLQFFIGILNRLTRVIGYPIVILLPREMLEYEDDDQDSLRAFRISKTLQKNGLMVSMETTHHMYADEPPGHVTIAKTSSGGFGSNGKGAHLFDASKTLWPALAEAVERFCLRNPGIQDSEYCDRSWNALNKPKVDIFNVAGLDEKIRNKTHPHFNLKYDQNTVFRWIPATDLITNKTIYAPLQWFSFKHTRSQVNKALNPKASEPLLSIPISTGAAAGQSETEAVLKGLFEVIERDAFIIYWLNQIPAKRIALTSLKEERFSEIRSIIDDYKLEVHLLYLQTDIPIHTLCIVVVDRTGVGPAVTVGAVTGRNVSDAAYSLLQDTLSQRGSFRGLRDENADSPKKQAVQLGHKSRILHWSEPEEISHIEPFVSGKLTDLKDLPTYDYTGNDKEDLQSILKFFADKDYQVVYRKLISSELEKITEGLSVVMVKAPQLQPLYLDESLRSIGGSRLREVPAYLGYPVNESETDPFSTTPHPFP